MECRDGTQTLEVPVFWLRLVLEQVTLGDPKTSWDLGRTQEA